MCPQGRSHTFEHGDLDGTQSPSHVAMGLPPYAIHDGSMSSSQSISSSNSGRDVAEPQEEGETPHDGAIAAGKGAVCGGLTFAIRLQTP